MLEKEFFALQRLFEPHFASEDMFFALPLNLLVGKGGEGKGLGYKSEDGQRQRLQLFLVANFLQDASKRSQDG